MDDCHFGFFFKCQKKKKKRKRTMVLLLTLFDNIPSKDWIWIFSWKKKKKKRKENKQSTFFQQYTNTYISFVHTRILSHRNPDPLLLTAYVSFVYARSAPCAPRAPCLVAQSARREFGALHCGCECCFGFAKELMVDKYHGFFIFFASAACCHCGAESS
jgi:hypothetical protein